MNLHGGVRHAVTEGELYLPQGPPSVTLRIGNLGLAALQPVQRLDDVVGLLLDQLLIQFAGEGWVVVQPYEETHMQASSGG